MAAAVQVGHELLVQLVEGGLQALRHLGRNVATCHSVVGKNGVCYYRILSAGNKANNNHTV